MLRSGSVYPPGTRIAGRYEVAGRPLMGGMGIVYLCFDHWERRPVALKTFLPELLPNRSARDRFLREGTTWVNLGSHAHIVRAYAVKRIGDGREVYLVLELVAKEQGRADASLRSWLVPGRPLPIEQALLFGLQIARGMAYATATIPGLVHRDLKPENVLVGRDRLPGMGVNRLRVTDFGLAALLQDSGVPAPEALEITGASRLRRTQLTRGVVGTPLYMAPEQWQGKGVCVQTDMYAFGCILHEMLAGHLAVEGNSTAELEQAHCGGRVQPLPIGLPAVVKRIVNRCLAREPGARYDSWEAVVEALAAAYAEVTRRTAPGPEPVQSLDRAERVAVGWSYTAMGLSYQDIGKLKVALVYSQRALEVGQAEAEHRLEIAGLKNMANAYSNLGDGRRAVRHCERALAIARKIGDRAEEGRALRNLGLICENPANMAWVRGYDVSRARGFFEQYLEIAREIGDRAEEGKALVSLGEFYALMWWPPRAIKLCKQALAIAREIGDRHLEGQALIGIGDAYAPWLPRRGKEFYEQALAVVRTLNDPQEETRVLIKLGLYEPVLAIAREIGDRRMEGYILVKLGRSQLLWRPRRAKTFYKQALAIARETGDRNVERYAIKYLGAMYWALDVAQRARGLAAKVWRRFGRPFAQRAQQLTAQIRAKLR